MITDKQSAIEYLRGLYPNAEIYEPVDALDYISVITVIGKSNFGMSQQNVLKKGKDIPIIKDENVIVNIYKTERYHIDTVRLMEINADKNKKGDKEL